MKTHYFNAFYNGDSIFIEQDAIYDYDEAVEDINNYNFPYAYTLEVSLDDTKRLDLESEALDKKYRDEQEAESDARHIRSELNRIRGV